MRPCSCFLISTTCTRLCQRLTRFTAFDYRVSGINSWPSKSQWAVPAPAFLSKNRRPPNHIDEVLPSLEIRYNGSAEPACIIDGQPVQHQPGVYLLDLTNNRIGVETSGAVMVTLRAHRITENPPFQWPRLPPVCVTQLIQGCINQFCPDTGIFGIATSHSDAVRGISALRMSPSKWGRYLSVQLKQLHYHVKRKFPRCCSTVLFAFKFL